MAIFRFFDFSKMLAVRHLGFVMCVFGHPRMTFGGLYRCAKFGWNRCSSFDNMHVFRFHEFGLKRLFTPPNWGFGGDLAPQMGSHINETQKGTSLRESVSFEPSCAKIRQRV